MNAFAIEQEEKKQLPARYQKMAPEELTSRIWQAKKALGNDLVIMGHHYQRDDVIQFADHRGDSLKLAQIAAAEREATYVVFCGVHFMAETADILTTDEQAVVLPDLQAGCSMADMADIDDLEEAWEVIERDFGETVIPVTYVNSTAAIKAFVGRHGGLTCTSSNAENVLQWCFEQKERVLFLPDQHLGRNTAVKFGIPLEQMIVWNPLRGAYDDVSGDLTATKVILWKGHCSVHQTFTVDHIRQYRERDPEFRILVHPECCYDVVQAADDDGSTDYIIKQIQRAPAGSKWAIGTEVNLVQRLAHEHPDVTVRLLSQTMCSCLTMNRIDQPHLLWVLESLLDGEVTNRIQVADDVAREAKTALDRMLALV